MKHSLITCDFYWSKFMLTLGLISLKSFKINVNPLEINLVKSMNENNQSNQSMIIMMMRFNENNV